ncbi:hypothetical protein ACNOYE_28945 [Nannocystaceae bacterium ST9]
MRSNLVLVVLVASLTTLACKREDTSSSPADPEPATTAAPESEPSDEPEPAASVDLDALCQHTLPIMREGLGLGDVEPTPEEAQTAMSECVRGLEDKQASTPADEFASKTECISRATTLDEIVACG